MGTPPKSSGDSRGFGGERRSSGMSELSPQAEAREKVNWPEGPREAALGRMELATTKGAASLTRRAFPQGKVARPKAVTDEGAVRPPSVIAVGAALCGRPQNKGRPRAARPAQPYPEFSPAPGRRCSPPKLSRPHRRSGVPAPDSRSGSAGPPGRPGTGRP